MAFWVSIILFFINGVLTLATVRLGLRFLCGVLLLTIFLYNIILNNRSNWFPFPLSLSLTVIQIDALSSKCALPTRQLALIDSKPSRVERLLHR
ncbi:hypothetical protein SCA6_001341 [Theobroma cacao]